MVHNLTKGATIMDRRVLNTSYSIPPVKLFMALASIMDDEEVAASAPFICRDGYTIRQTYGSCPAQVGGDLYWRLSPSGEEVYVFDPEMEDMMDADEKESWEWCDVEFHQSWPVGSNMAMYILRYVLQGN